MVADRIVEEIRARADLVEICGRHMSLKKVGKSWRGPCPLHGGDGPNFSIDPTRGIFKCFVCGESGDVFSFVMKHLGHDFPSAVRHLGDVVGVEVPDPDEEREDPHAHLREVLAFADEWFRERLRGEEGADAREYLRGRGIEMEVALEHGLGFAPDAWRGLRDAAAPRGFEDEDLLRAGLLATSEKSPEPYDRFRHRLIFSIRDLRDRAIAFGGRDLSSKEDVPKYINSPESPVFTKGRTLYGLHRARHAMRKEEFGIVVEGYTDVLSLQVRGLEMTVAPLGTALTAEQADTLARYAQKVYLIYDSDAAGLRATFKSADTLLASGVHPLVVTLPEGEDPDSLVRGSGVGELREHLRDAVDALERKLQILERKGYLETIEGRRRAVDGLLSTLRAASDSALQDLYLGRVVERLGVRRETLVREVARRGHPRRRRSGGPRRGSTAGGPPPGRPGPPRDETPPPGPGGADEGGGAGAPGRARAERDLLLLLLRDDTGSLVEKAAAAGLGPEHFQRELYRPVYRGLLNAHGSRAHGNWDEIFSGETLKVVAELEEDATEFTRADEIFGRLLRLLVHGPKLERLRAIDRELELTEEEQGRKLLEEKQRLRRELEEEEVGLGYGFLRRFVDDGR